MRLEIVVSKAKYHYYRIALVEVKPTYNAERVVIGFKNRHLRVLECRQVAKTRLPEHRDELQQIKHGLEEMELETTFFHQKCGFDFVSLVKNPREKRGYTQIDGNGHTHWIVGHKELNR